jgi:hypothetical protein
MFAALENFYDSEDINTAWETLKRIPEPQPKRVNGSTLNHGLMGNVHNF